MRRKITRLLLSAVLMMCCTVSALAQLGTPPNDEIWYTTTDGNTCTPYKEGIDVFGTTIRSNTYDANGHGTIKFNGSVTSIGEYAFYQCSNLTSITIPNRVTNIGQSAFESCSGLNSVTIPNSVTNIGQSAFESCSNLSSVTIPNSVTSIGAYAFQYCTSLTTVTIPNSITIIGKYAFQFCENLHDVFFWGENNITLEWDVFFRTSATIYVGDKIKFPETWGDRPVLSWRSGNGDGTRESPYEIENYMNLYGFSLEVLQGNTSICGKLTADITANNNVLKADGTLNAGVFKPWEPIGSWGGDPIIYNGYSGEFNGNGHTISGLYLDDENRTTVGLFGMADNFGYIHDVGIKDSYFRGKSHVAGICGDLAKGRIENCWNGATVIAPSGYVGGLTGSCWYSSSVSGCYNIGKVSSTNSNALCGGICGSVTKNVGDKNIYVSDCVSLEGKCDRAYNLSNGTDISIISNVSIQNSSAFESGDVCWILNGNNIGTKWRQQIGKDSYPVWTGNYLVNHSDGKGYYNETMCEKENGIHSFIKEEVKKCDNSTFVYYWHCTKCGNDFTDADRTKEETDANKSCHFPEYVMGIVPTETTKGRYGYYQCTSCHKKFKDELCCESWANENELIVPEAKKSEIWYTSINNEVIPPYKSDVFGATIKDNTYNRGLGVITFDKDVTSTGINAFTGINSDFPASRNLQTISIPSSVTSIGNYAFEHCYSLQSINIPSGVTSIGKYAFSECGKMESITFNSLPNVVSYAFYKCNISTKILDLTDSDKPYIGTSLANYPSDGFTEARYHRTLANDGTTWGTITLPFVPASTEGLKFYTLKDAASDKVVLTEVTNIEAGVPYLFKNCSESADFTLTAANPTVVVNPIEQEAINGMKLVGAFRKNEFTGDGTKYGLYGGNTFMTTTGALTINPFRAYLETAVSGAKAIVIDNEADGIDDIRHLSSAQSQEGVNVQGMRVGNSYKGIVIKNGKKYLNR